MPRDASHSLGGGQARLEHESTSSADVRGRALAVDERRSAPSGTRSENSADRETLSEGLAGAPEPTSVAPPQAGVLLRTDRRGCGQLIALPAVGARLGRGWEAEARVDDDGVSRLHARITLDDGRFWISDLSSKNGTFVDEQRVTAALLKDGSLVRLGARVCFRFSLVGEDEQRALSYLQELGHNDPLTHVYNRRHLEQHLAAELAFAERHATSISLILLDIDRFKAVNDEYGHPAGDQVLERVAAVMGEQIRVEDMLARYGGEEFVIVLRETPIAGAEALAERIRRAVAEVGIEISGVHSLRVTLSAGCASLACTGNANVDELVQLADRRLYLAKQQGRNRVVGAAPRLRTIPSPAPASTVPAVDLPASEVAPAERHPGSQVNQLDRMARAFEALPRELRLVVGLHHQENCSFAEIAAILESTEANVAELYRQARIQMLKSAA
jgi:two-component system, cell cycle response regulator